MKNISKKLKNNKKLAIIKLPHSPTEYETRHLAKSFRGTQYKPIFIVSDFNFKQGNLIIG